MTAEKQFLEIIKFAIEIKGKFIQTQKIEDFYLPLSYFEHRTML